MRGLLRFLTTIAGLFVAARAITKPDKATQPNETTRLAQASSPNPPAANIGLLACLRGLGWKRLLATALALLVIVGVGGFLVAASGVIPIKASSGHWAITEWMLQFSMKRSIATHTLGMTAPPLDDPALVLKGAGHYETGCFPCHGSPEVPQPRVAAAMLPPAPYLPPRVGDWDDEGLFYLVNHGVKFTGMPAWPARHRDDEVWAMVAFLRALPDLNVNGYRSLVRGEAGGGVAVAPLEDLVESRRAKVADVIAESCARCHGFEGEGRGNSAFPTLAGQRAPYLVESLKAYANGDRPSGIMGPVAAALLPEDREAIAEYYSAQPAVRADDAARSSTGGTDHDAQAIERGRLLAENGLPKQRVAACVGCHGPNEVRQNPLYPVLAGQYAGYLQLQLELFRKGHRGGTAYSHIMHEVASGLNPEQLRDVAAYYHSLEPDGDSADESNPAGE